MKKFLALLLAAGLTLTAPIAVSAGQGPVTPVPASSAATGPWIVGGVGFGVISLMVRAGYVGYSENRELTSGEATSAFLLPFFWTIYPGNFLGEPKHTRRDGSIKSYDFNRKEIQERPFKPALISESPTHSGRVRLAPTLSKPPKPGTPTLGGSGGSQKN